MWENYPRQSNSPNLRVFFPQVTVLYPERDVLEQVGMPPTDHPVPITPGPLLAACHRMLRPLARLMIRGGITVPALNEMLRVLFVDVAANEILTDARARSDSRISLVTGIHRKEIRRLRALPAEQ